MLQIYADPLLMVKRQDHPERLYQVNLVLRSEKQFWFLVAMQERPASPPYIFIFEGAANPLWPLPQQTWHGTPKVLHIVLYRCV